MRVATFLLSLLVFSLPAAVAARVARRLAASARDEWKLIMWVPVVPLALWGPFVAVAVSRDRTSHNLWPFELAAWTLLTVVLFGAVLLARRLVGRPTDDWSARRDRDGRP